MPARPAGPGAAGRGPRLRRSGQAVREEHGAGDVSGRLQHDGGRRRQRRAHPARPPRGPDQMRDRALLATGGSTGALRRAGAGHHPHGDTGVQDRPIIKDWQ